MKLVKRFDSIEAIRASRENIFKKTFGDKGIEGMENVSKSILEGTYKFVNESVTPEKPGNKTADEMLLMSTNDFSDSTKPADTKKRVSASAFLEVSKLDNKFPVYQELYKDESKGMAVYYIDKDTFLEKEDPIVWENAFGKAKKVLYVGYYPDGWFGLKKADVKDAKTVLKAFARSEGIAESEEILIDPIMESVDLTCGDKAVDPVVESDETRDGKAVEPVKESTETEEGKVEEPVVESVADGKEEPSVEPVVKSVDNAKEEPVVESAEVGKEEPVVEPVDEGCKKEKKEGTVEEEIADEGCKKKKEDEKVDEVLDNVGKKNVVEAAAADENEKIKLKRTMRNQTKAAVAYNILYSFLGNDPKNDTFLKTLRNKLKLTVGSKFDDAGVVDASYMDNPIWNRGMKYVGVMESDEFVVNSIVEKVMLKNKEYSKEDVLESVLGLVDEGKIDIESAYEDFGLSYLD